MRYGSTRTFHNADGSTVTARDFFLNPSSKLCDGCITDDGRVIHCRDEQTNLFWFEDTLEELRLIVDGVVPN